METAAVALPATLSREEPHRSSTPETPDAATDVELQSQPHDNSTHHAPIASQDIERRLSSWLCVFGAFLFLLPTYGFPQSIGTVQAYLQENQLSDYSARDIGWITGLYTALTLFLGIQAGPVIDRHGVKLTAPVAAALTVPMFFLLAECSKFWHFFLCLGVFGGLGGALASTIAVSVVGKLFTRLRGLAIGAALTGSAFGGVVFPFMLRELLPTWGWTWSIRFVGFAVTGFMIVGTFCFMPFTKLIEASGQGHRGGVLTPTSTRSAGSGTRRSPIPRATSAAVNFSAFRSPAFSFIAATFFLLEFVIFGISGTLPTLSNLAGNSPETGYNLIAIINGCGCIGRVGSGFLGDRFGHYNVLILGTVSTAFCVAVSFVPFGTRYVEALYAFAALWGFSSGIFSVLIPACMGKTCEAKDYGRCFGTLNFTVSFSLLITVPIGGQMLQTLGGMALAGLYVGVLCMAAFTMLASRSLLVGSWFNYRLRM